MKRTAAAAVPVLLVLVTACGSSSSGGAASTSAAPASSSTPSAAPTSSSPSPTAPALPAAATSDDPQAVAVSLKEQIPQITRVIQVTESNDSNNLIGRPGKYDAASFMKDSRMPCTGQNLKTLDTSGGAKVERWASTADAQARADYIQKNLKALPMLGTEYDYVRDNLLLRVAGDLKPSQAKAYEKAFVG